MVCACALPEPLQLQASAPARQIHTLALRPGRDVSSVIAGESAEEKWE